MPRHLTFSMLSRSVPSGFIEHFLKYFSAARPKTTLAFVHLKIVDQNASSEAELLDLMSIPYM